MKINLTKILLMFGVITLSIQIANAQTEKQNKHQTSDSCDCPVEYNDVLNNLFPRNILSIENGNIIILRYRSSNKPEIQINISYFKFGRYEVNLYKSKNKSILLQLQDTQYKDCNASFGEIIKQIKFDKTRIEITENEVSKIRAGFFEAVKKSNDFENKMIENSQSNSITLYFESVNYEAEYFGFGYISLSGGGNSIESNPHKDEPPFIEWMREVFRIVEKKKK